MNGGAERCNADRLPAAGLRGGNWNNGSQAGAFSMNLNHGPSNWNTNIGSRCCREKHHPIKRQHPGPHGGRHAGADTAASGAVRGWFKLGSGSPRTERR
jgi:hypothetical protein